MCPAKKKKKGKKKKKSETEEAKLAWVYTLISLTNKYNLPLDTSKLKYHYYTVSSSHCMAIRQIHRDTSLVNILLPAI